MMKKVFSVVLAVALLFTSLVTVNAVEMDSVTLPTSAKIEVSNANQGAYSSSVSSSSTSVPVTFDFKATLDMTNTVRSKFTDYVNLAKARWGDDVVGKNVSGQFDLIIDYPKTGISVPAAFTADTKTLYGFTGIDTEVFEEVGRSLDSSGATNVLTITLKFKPVAASTTIANPAKYLPDIVLECEGAQITSFGSYTIRGSVTGQMTIADVANLSLSFNNGEGITPASVSITKSGEVVSGGGGGSTIPDKETTTVVNPDGSTTTTVKDNKTGTVTETTNKTDGGEKVVETKKDGTVTTTKKDTEGNTSESVKTPDGTVTSNVTQADGTKAEAVTDTEGKTSATVTVPEGTEKTEVVIPVEDATSGTVVYVVEEDGTKTLVMNATNTEDGMSIPLSGNAKLEIVDNTRGFIDIGGHWAEDNINFVSSRGIFNGVSATHFAPDMDMTRGMIMTVIANMEGVDVSPDEGEEWYENAVEWAVANGVSDGTNPEEIITREQFVTMLWRYIGHHEVEGDHHLDEFHDKHHVSDYAVDAMHWAVAHSLIEGMGDGRVAPQEDALRCQAAKIMMRFVLIK